MALRAPTLVRIMDPHHLMTTTSPTWAAAVARSGSQCDCFEPSALRLTLGVGPILPYPQRGRKCLSASHYASLAPRVPRTCRASQRTTTAPIKATTMDAMFTPVAPGWPK